MNPVRITLALLVGAVLSCFALPDADAGMGPAAVQRCHLSAPQAVPVAPVPLAAPAPIALQTPSTIVETPPTTVTIPGQRIEVPGQQVLVQPAPLLAPSCPGGNCPQLGVLYQPQKLQVHRKAPLKTWRANRAQRRGTLGLEE